MQRDVWTSACHQDGKVLVRDSISATEFEVKA